MGQTISMLCSSKHSEEELVSQYLHSMEIAKIDINKAYSECLDCIFEGRVDAIKYKQFVVKVVGNSPFQEIQLEFFENLLKSTKKNAQVKRIGTTVCFLAEGSQINKVKLLTQHIKKYYGDSDNSIKEFINDVIDINTDNCYLSFKSKIDPEITNHLIEVWKKPRKTKLFFKIYENYESACKKYFSQVETKKKEDNERQVNAVSNSSQILLRKSNPPKTEEELCKIKLFLDLSFSSLEGKFLLNFLLI